MSCMEYPQIMRWCLEYVTDNDNVVGFFGCKSISLFRYTLDTTLDKNCIKDTKEIKLSLGENMNYVIKSHENRMGKSKIEIFEFL